MEKLDESIFRYGTYGYYATRDYTAFNEVYRFSGVPALAVLFYAEQAIEKSFKHLLALRGYTRDNVIMQGHDLPKLAHSCDFVTDNRLMDLFFLSQLYLEEISPLDVRITIPIEPVYEDVQRIAILVDDVLQFLLTRVKMQNASQCSLVNAIVSQPYRE